LFGTLREQIPVAARSKAWPLACWDCGFESHRGHGCLSVVSIVCWQVEVSASGWSLVQRIPTKCSVYEGDHESSSNRCLGPVGLLRHGTKKNTFAINALLDKSEASTLVIPKSAVGQNLNLFYPPSSFKPYSNNINFNASTFPSRFTTLLISKTVPTKTTKTKSRTISLNAWGKEGHVLRLIKWLDES